jgi:dTDP-4-dehydrorhamnose reductase
MRILVLGGGFLGMKVAEALNAELVTERITDSYSLYETMADKVMDFPEVIINCIGKTGRPNVDWCESNKSETYVSNVHVPYILAEFCKKHNIKLVHISSGCIYQGDNGGKGFSESDTPNFTGSFYSFTKAMAEQLVSTNPDSLILRMRMPIADTPSDRELIGKLLRYQTIVNTPNSVTIVDDLNFLNILSFLIKNNASGIYNVCNPEPVTHKQILDIYEEMSGKKLNKKYIEAKDLTTAAPRSNCVLNTDKVQNLHFGNNFCVGMRKTDTAIRSIINEYIKNGG